MKKLTSKNSMLESRIDCLNSEAQKLSFKQQIFPIRQNRYEYAILPLELNCKALGCCQLINLKCQNRTWCLSLQTPKG